MADNGKLTGYKLPVNPDQKQGTVAQGFVTPKQDKKPQIQAVPPRRVLPIVFIPGIMGSNLRMTSDRQKKLGQKNNIAWRPDSVGGTLPQYNDSAAERQLRLDPDATEVDIYDPSNNPTGDTNETSDQRNHAVQINFLYCVKGNLDGPLLQADVFGTPNPKDQNQKARERGWGEVYFDSYKDILTTCEHRLNSAFTYGSIDLYLLKSVMGVDPLKWQATPNQLLKPLDEKSIREIVKNCWFPVHAMGYNWLKGNGDSGFILAQRIKEMMKRYQNDGYQCEKVILITHSMGGLVARAVMHPEIGNLNDIVLGVVHGVMPAIGAGTAYKRVRCGFEGSGISTKILGENGSHVTSVLGNAQGGLELLPSQAYGNNWLQVKQNGMIIKSLPQNGDPYEEIYKLHDNWLGLLREKWINPAHAKTSGFKNTCALLDRAKEFHSTINNFYHDCSYGHYGADKNRVAWRNVIWEIDSNAKIENLEGLKIASDDGKGKLRVIDPALQKTTNSLAEFNIKLSEPIDPGDQTVPLHSADVQLVSGKFKGIFRQTGYEHQASYSNAEVIATTVYCLLQIISTMKWSKQ